MSSHYTRKEKFRIARFITLMCLLAFALVSLMWLLADKFWQFVFVP